MKVLVVDDSNAIRYITLKILREIGHRDAMAVSSPDEALQLMEKEKFDLILLDWNLPKMSGLDLLKIIRSKPQTEDTSVIMITSVNERSCVIEALKVGVQGYMFKPVQKETLEAKINEVLAKRNPPEVPAEEQNVAEG